MRNRLNGKRCGFFHEAANDIAIPSTVQESTENRPSLANGFNVNLFGHLFGSLLSVTKSEKSRECIFVGVGRYAIALCRTQDQNLVI